jgi:hypothetical protein
LNLAIKRSTALFERGNRQTNTQRLRALCRVWAECTQADQIAAEAREQLAACMRFEGDVGAQTGGNSWR